MFFFLYHMHCNTPKRKKKKKKRTFLTPKMTFNPSRREGQVSQGQGRGNVLIVCGFRLGCPVTSLNC